MQGRAIDTIGSAACTATKSRSTMVVPGENLIGLDDGVGRGFYYRWKFRERPLQPPPAPWDSCRPRTKRPATTHAIAWCSDNRSPSTNSLRPSSAHGVAHPTGRQFAYRVSAVDGRRHWHARGQHGQGLRLRAAEWVTREAMQIHGGMGYAENFRSAVLRRRPRALDFRRRRRDALHQSHHTAPHRGLARLRAVASLRVRVHDDGVLTAGRFVLVAVSHLRGGHYTKFGTL